MTLQCILFGHRTKMFFSDKKKVWVEYCDRCLEEREIINYKVGEKQ
jgi:hypothetical protein